MSDKETKKSIADRISMNQEPADRIWAIIYAIAAVVLLLGGLVVETRLYLSDVLSTGRELDYERGSVDCLSVVVDNDRNFELPPYCGKPEIVVFYPREVCDDFFPNTEVCGLNRKDS